MNNLIGVLGAYPNQCITPEKILHGIEHFHMEGYEAILSNALQNDNISKFYSVKFNWVVSVNGLSLAQKLYSDYKIPYLAALPVGKRAMFQWRNAVNRLMENAAAKQLIVPSPVAPLPNILQKNILLLGDPVLTAGIKNFLIYSEGYKNIDTALFLPISEQLSSYEDMLQKSCLFTLNQTSINPSTYFTNIDEWKAAAAKYDIIIGDKKFYDILPALLQHKQHWIYLPDNGSGTNNDYTIFGKKGAAWLQNKLGLPITKAAM